MILKAPDVESLQKVIDEKKHSGIVVKDPREIKIYIYGHYGVCGWVLKMPPNLDHEKLQESIRELIERHPALRAYITKKEPWMFSEHKLALGSGSVLPMHSAWLHSVFSRALWGSWPP